jgi:hypothetical protein
MIGVAVCLAANPATAETASDAIEAFGLVGVWSPDCAGPFRTIYSISPGGPPTVRLTVRGEEYATSEIQETQRSAGSQITGSQITGSQIKWRSIIKTWTLTDRPHEGWMPEPGEIWETVIEKTGDKIRPIQSHRGDGQKISVKDGFIYTKEDGKDLGSMQWRNTGEATLPLERCPAGGGTRM